jgi:phosphoribosylamine--glycine ligase
MKILVVGSGGREHAIVHALTRNSSEQESQHELLTAPGNAGTARLGRNVAVRAEAVDELVLLAEREAVDLVIVGPEAPLVLGLADRLRAANIPVCGPSAAAARLEGSKSFAKDFMRKYDIPTAAFRTFGKDDAEAAAAYLREAGAPIVVKASGLAAGKGAVVCRTEEEALSAVASMLTEGSLGDAGSEVVIEEFMDGEEASLFAVADGTDYVLLPTAQDHKRIGDGDKGPNTGGMGAYAPAPVMTPELLNVACKRIVEPVLAGMRAEGHPYSGILYCGLMISPQGPRVVEFNCRLGDPEAQVVLPLMESDPVELFLLSALGRLSEYRPVFRDGSAACVVLASSGYPGSYEKGKTIEGVPAADGMDGVTVYLAGVGAGSNGNLVTTGGRVLAVTGRGPDLSSALDSAYGGVERIRFDGQYFRRDIGARGLAREESE